MEEIISMKISISKTKIQSAAVPLCERTLIHLNVEALEGVEEFKYLWAKFTDTGQGRDEISTHINYLFYLLLVKSSLVSL